MSTKVSVKPGAAESDRTGPGSTIRVVSIRTGLPMDTLRAWERRYGFPKPQRRPGSNRRLYAEADVERLVAMARTIDRGYRIGDVVGMPLRELIRLAAENENAARLPSHPADVEGLLDRCPHKGGPLSQGIVFGHSVACPLHNWTIGLDDGCARAPDVGCAVTFSVMCEGGRVHLDAVELATRGLEGHFDTAQPGAPGDESAASSMAAHAED